MGVQIRINHLCFLLSGGTCGEGSDGYELFGIYCKLPPYKSRTASVFLGSASYLRGSLSASEGEKKTEGWMMGKTHKSCAPVEDMTKMSIAIKGGPRKSLGGRGGRTLVVGVGLSIRHRHGGTSCQPLHDTERLQFINSIRKGLLGAHIKRVIALLFEVLTSLFHLLSAIMLYHSYM